jgi:hypothetical protein
MRDDGVCGTPAAAGGTRANSDRVAAAVDGWQRIRDFLARHLGA